ncbi:MAG: hypothetical protein IT578_07435 [Verrucomicrobiae bacterium]|nr:hypothetical protein [Verrucomicrobiae bacterium]
MKVRRVPIPRTRDPFVNAALTPLGTDARGVEWFWTSSCNPANGSLGVVLDARGEHRVVRFGDGRLAQFYSAARGEDGALWLCGFSDRVVRLDWRTGRWKVFETGAPRAMVAAGMAFDPPSGKLFFVFHAREGTLGCSFDTRAKRAQTAPIPGFHAHSMRASFPNGDGTWTFVCTVPGVNFVRWDPRDDSASFAKVRDRLDTKSENHLFARFIERDGRRYVPTLGWYNPAKGIFGDGPRPSVEHGWFGREGTLAYGVSGGGSDAQVWEWEMSGGSLRPICQVADVARAGLALARGKILSVNYYGVFQRFDAASGSVECAKRLRSDAVGRVDCVARLDRDRVIGTAFITQRFWTRNLRTGEGTDCGRAAPGSGQVTKVAKAGRNLYLAAYTGGELVELRPDEPIRFPENPSVVATPPGGMRPLSLAQGGRVLWYACSAPYGKRGSVLTRFDTATGIASYRQNPFLEEMVCSLSFDPRGGRLLAATTLHNDCFNLPPAAKACRVAAFDPNDLSTREDHRLPEGIESACVLGPLGGGRWACGAWGAPAGREKGFWIFEIAMDSCRPPEPEAWRFLTNDWTLPAYGGQPGTGLHFSGRPGLFYRLDNHQLELWDFRAMARKGVLWKRDPRIERIALQDGEVFLLMPKQVVILKGAALS